MLDFVVDALALYLKYLAGFWFYPIMALALFSCIPSVIRHFFWRA